jgi:hypothetical protein
VYLLLGIVVIAFTVAILVGVIALMFHVEEKKWNQ